LPKIFEKVQKKLGSRMYEVLPLFLRLCHTVQSSQSQLVTRF